MSIATTPQHSAAQYIMSNAMVARPGVEAKKRDDTRQRLQWLASAGIRDGTNRRMSLAPLVISDASAMERHMEIRLGAFPPSPDPAALLTRLVSKRTSATR